MHGFAKCCTETPYFDNVNLDTQLVNYTLSQLKKIYFVWTQLGKIRSSLYLSTSGTLTNKVRTAQLILKGGIKNY